MWVLLTPILIFASLTLLCKYLWSRRHIYVLSWKLPGPDALPIIGNGDRFIGEPEGLFNKMLIMFNSYPKPMRVWLGPKMLVVFSDPNHLEKLLTSTKITYKQDIYNFLKDYVGEGLISHSGPMWKKHRKLIQPIFNLKFVTESMEIFQRHGEVLVKRLTDKLDGSTFDVLHMFHDCYGDIISEAVYGIQLNAQHGQNHAYTQATIDFYNVLYVRFVKPWIHPEFIFARTKHGKQRDGIVQIVRPFCKKVIDNIKTKKAKTGEELEEDHEIFKCATEILLDKSNGVLNDAQLIDHALTLYAASEDTMTSVAAFTAVCLGMNLNYQEKAAEEIRALIGESPRVITFDEVNKLKYLEMCIRESLRLFPIAPFILRKVTEDFPIDKWVLPVGSSVVFAMFLVHRDPLQWERPEEYYPDHFLPEAVEKRHPFAFIPFSSGPRGCIGQMFAYAGLKVIMANILQRFEIEADGTLKDLPLKMDISIRSMNGHKIRIKNRVWK